jgi:hypothetical protein
VKAVVAALLAFGAGAIPVAAAAGLSWLRGVPLLRVGEEPIVLTTLASTFLFGLITLWIVPLAGGLRKSGDSVLTAFLLASILPGLLACFGLLWTPWAEQPLLWLAGVILFYLPGPLIAAALAWAYRPPEP